MSKQTGSRAAKARAQKRETAGASNTTKKRSRAAKAAQYLNQKEDDCLDTIKLHDLPMAFFRLVDKVTALEEQIGTGRAQAAPPDRQIKVQFTIEPASYHGKLFAAAIAHYSGGAAIGEWPDDDGKSFHDAIARQILFNWLQSRIELPTLHLADAGEMQAVPAKRTRTAEEAE